MSVIVDIVSDVICPWCFLGKRHLDRAIASLEEGAVEVRWRPFLLDASIPKEGMDRKAYLTAKFGAERLEGLHAPLIAAGRAAGVPYHFERITRTPNTLNAHRLIAWSHAAGKQHEMAERLFMDYWSEGKDVGDTRVLIDAAVAVGLDATLVAQLLGSEADLDRVIAEINRAAEFGITGVPT
ncbi:MAG TPA: DsbA family oxidoreductase, partial [Aestuariivirga sp.]|nr:DsbA family oxidoreductase [Aestuariivirga sp.]